MKKLSADIQQIKEHITNMDEDEFFAMLKDCGFKPEEHLMDKECLECKRYFTGSCDGTEDRKREKITIENSCSGFLHIETEDVIDKVYNIVLELDARESGGNCVFTGLQDKSWTELCEIAISLLEQIK